MIDEKDLQEWLLHRSGRQQEQEKEDTAEEV
jgi:hypothetical protein